MCTVTALDVMADMTRTIRLTFIMLVPGARPFEEAMVLVLDEILRSAVRKGGATSVARPGSR